MKYKDNRVQITIDHARQFFVITLMFVSLCLFQACGSQIRNVHSDPSVTTLKQATCRAPIIVAAVIDQSGSMKWSGTPPVTIDDLRPLFDKLTNCGGELGVSFVRDHSNFGIERLMFPEPPREAAQPVRKDGEEEYEFVDRLAAFRQMEAERARLVEKQGASNEPRVNEFIARIGPLMAKPFSGRTDLNTGLNRADIFLAEPGNFWQKPPAKFLVIVSDAIDTEKQPRFAIRSAASVFWVNATTDERSSPAADVIRFESFGSAVRQITRIDGEVEKDNARP